MSSPLSQLGQVILGAYFFYNGLKHVFLKTKDYVGYSQMKGVPNPTAAVYVSGALLLVGGIGIATQLYLEVALWCLVAFLIPVSLKMHAFWKVQDPSMRAMEAVQFGKNVALLGAVLSMMY
jgi:uncharacterized membrane protein YphA (DoxX/SURF4 family)